VKEIIENFGGRACKRGGGDPLGGGVSGYLRETEEREGRKQTTFSNSLTKGKVDVLVAFGQPTRCQFVHKK